MADSTKVKNAAADDTPEQRADFKRTQAYDPSHLKKIDLWSQKSSPELFGRLGKGMTK